MNQIMQKYQDFRISIPKGTRSSFVQSLDKAIEMSEYKRRVDIEEKHINTFGKEEFALLIIESPEIELKNEIVKVLIWLQINDEIVRLLNIVPISNTTLVPELYNEILNRFLLKFIVPISKEYNLNYHLSNAYFSMEDFLGVDTFNLLKLFSSSANKDTANTHPSDFRRWCDFIISVHKKNIKLDSLDLEEWLVGHSWDSKVASRLIIDFEYSLELLKYYDTF